MNPLLLREMRHERLRLACCLLALLAGRVEAASATTLIDKTLVAWVSLANSNQQGGSALTLIDKAEHFDAIVFGEVARGKWMAGSDFFRRTHKDQAAWPVEGAGSDTWVQLAITYHSNQITLFRNSREYATYAMGQAQSFGDDAMVLLGLRYIGAMGEIGFLSGAIEDARIYDRALNPKQIAGLRPNQSSELPPLAWWAFENGQADDVMKRFPTARLEGNARVADGKLVLDGRSYLWAAKDPKALSLEPEDETPFDTSVQTMFYKARSKRTGNMWDTWLYLHQGEYYLYYLANSRGQWDNISMARSPDGVHWTELGRVLSKGRGVTWMGTGSTWKSPNFDKDAKFFMNFSEWKGPRQTIFFAESKDLVHWTRLGNEYEFVQDERWYERNGRWDCIWTIPRPGGGLYGYWTATPKKEAGGRFGFGETLDGITWKALAPPKVTGAGEGEVGAIEKIGDQYYMMFGTGGLMVTLVAERPEGPFVAARKNLRLLAGHTYFARFFPTADGVLVNHHSIARDSQVSFGSLKATRLDDEGTLRLAWWKGNEKMKGRAVAVKPPASRVGELPAVDMVETPFDASRGVILEGTLKLPASQAAKPVGLYLAQTNDSGTAILIHAGGVTEFGPMCADGTGFKGEHRVDREWKFGATARFRLLLKGSLVEFYVDDLLMQCYSLPQKAAGRVGLIQAGDANAVTSLKAWQADAPADADAPSASSSPLEFPVKPLTEAKLKTAGFGESFANDPTAGTWLDPSGTMARFIRTLQSDGKVLDGLWARMRLLACWYSDSHLVATRSFAEGELQTPGSRWTCAAVASAVPGEADARDWTVTFKLIEGTEKSTGVAVAFDFADWSTNHYVLIPASVYNGNRNRIEYRGYCTGFDPGDFYHPDLPVTHGDVPRLELEAGKPSQIEVSACNASTPALCVFDRKAGRGFIILAEQAGRNARGEFLRKPNGEILDNSFVVEESADRTRATLVVSAPGVRERKPEFIGFSPSPDRGLNLSAGDEVSLRLRIVSFAAAGIPALLDKFMTVRKAVTGPNHPRNLIPFSDVARLMTGRIDGRWHESAAGQYYCPENSDKLCLGWIGGLMNTFPMLVLGDEDRRRRASSTFDFVIPAAVGRSGYFLATVHADGKAHGRDWFPNQPIVLTRQNADVLYWMTKQFLLLKAQGHGEVIKPEWERATRGLAQAFVSTWKRHGQWGNYVNHETGDVAIYNSTSGAMAIGGLALAAGYFGEPEWMTIARRAANDSYQRDFVQKGFTYGACSDIMQNADSETAAALMTSLMTLYETTGDTQWLEKSRHLAHLVATWTVSYDYELPANTELGKLGAKLAGTYWASTQNKHGAPGICTSSGDALFKIYRATGDSRYAELLRDIVHAHAEGIKPGGEITERLTYCDADSRGSRGGGSTGWCELNGALMAMELPGIYVRQDSDRCFVFDSLEAKILSSDPAGVKMEIRNPTPFAVRVSILAEDAAEAKKPLGCVAFLQWPKFEVKAGATAQITVPLPSGPPKP